VPGHTASTSRRLGDAVCSLSCAKGTNHQLEKVSSAEGERCCQPQWRSDLNQTSRENGHCSSRWSRCSRLWAHKAHSSLERRPCRKHHSDVQHLPRRARHRKNDSELAKKFGAENRCLAMEECLNKMSGKSRCHSTTSARQTCPEHQRKARPNC
jgi:hypothetical protein